MKRFFALCLFLTACGGGGGGSLPAQNQSVLTSTPTQSTGTPTPVPLATDYETDLQYQFTQPTTGIYAVQSFDPSLQAKMQPNDELYAATMRPQNGCLETTTFYNNQSSGIWVWDFCGIQTTNEPAGKIAIIDANLSQHLGNLGGQLPEYVVESYRDGSGLWHVFLWNFVSNKWDDLYDQPTSDAMQEAPYWGYGWDSFEFHTKNPSDCAQSTFVSSRNIMVLNNLTWSSPSQPTEMQWYPSGVSCSYVFNPPVTNPLNYWEEGQNSVLPNMAPTPFPIGTSKPLSTVRKAREVLPKR